MPGWGSTATGGPDRGIWNTGATGKDSFNIAFAYRNNAFAQQLSDVFVAKRTYTLDYLQGRTGNSTRGTAELWAGGTLTNVSETIAYQEVTDATVTVSFATGDVQYLYINPAGASVAITLPADPGAVSKAGILFIKNNTAKAHTWAASPAVRFVDQADADTVPTPAAVGYYTRYTCQWMDNNAGTGAWWVTVAGRDTA
jgi:hypothetical protein